MNEPEERQVLNPKVCIGNYCFPEEDVKRALISTINEDNFSFNKATIHIEPNPDSKWDYRAEATLDENGERLMTGICVSANAKSGGEQRISLRGPFWKLKHSQRVCQF